MPAAADRVRECRQSPVGPRRGAPTRVGPARRVRREPVAAGAPADRRKPGALGAGGRCRIPGRVGSAAPVAHGAGASHRRAARPSARLDAGRRSFGAGHFGRPRDGPGSRVSCSAPGIQPGAQKRRFRIDGRAQRLGAARSGDDPGGIGAGVAPRRGPAAAQPGRRAGRRPRIQSGKRFDSPAATAECPLSLRSAAARVHPATPGCRDGTARRGIGRHGE